MRISTSSKVDGLSEDHRLELARVHLELVADAQRGLADIAAGRTVEADAAIAERQRQRAGAAGQTVRLI
jgi:predicted transcriptional regulator